MTTDEGHGGLTNFGTVGAAGCGNARGGVAVFARTQASCLRERLSAPHGLTRMSVALVALLAGCSPSPPEKPPSGSSGEAIEEEWFLVSFEGRPAGSLHTATYTTEAGGHAVEFDQQLRIQRVDTPLDMRLSLRMEEDASGRFTGFSFEQGLAKQSLHSRGRVIRGQLEITERGPDGKERSSSLPARSEAVGYYFAEKQLRALCTGSTLTPGSRLETVAYLPELRRFGKETAVFVKRETIDLAGQPRDVWRTEVTQEALPGFVVTRWVDDEGRIQKYSVPLLGMEVVYERSSKEATASLEVESPPEIFVRTSIRVERPVATNCDEAVYRLRFPSEKSRVDPAMFLRFSGQREQSREPHALVLHVERVSPPGPFELPLEPPAGEDRQTLLPNSYVQSDDARIRAVAKAAIGEERDAWKAARALERWVYDRIDEKNLETAFATAREVLDTGAGDCTEHSVLLAALTRAVGIPSRVVAGLLYSQGALVGHMWTEVYVGQWIPLDATLGRGSVGADHIAISSSSLGGSALGDLFIQLVQVLGDLDVEVLSSR